MDSPEAAKQLLLVLLQHFIERRPLPPRAPMFVPPPTAQNRGVLRLVRSAAGELHLSVNKRLTSSSSDTCTEWRQSEIKGDKQAVRTKS